MSWNPERLPDLHGRTFVVTGATGGIGYFAAEQLAAAGARVVLASRNRDKLARAGATIRTQVPDAQTLYVEIDLTSLQSVKTAGEELAEMSGLDGIFLNGGPMQFSASTLTRDGLPLMLGGHAIANVALIGHLLPSVFARTGRRPFRIVHASTGFVQQFRADPGRVDRVPRLGIHAYVRAKVATEVFAFELESRLRALGAPAESIVTRPGVGVDAKTPYRPGIRDDTVRYQPNPYTPWAQGKDSAAWPGVRALTDPLAAGGQYYGPDGGQRGRPVLVEPYLRTSAPQEELVKRVWARMIDMGRVSFSL